MTEDDVEDGVEDCEEDEEEDEDADEVEVEVDDEEEEEEEEEASPSVLARADLESVRSSEPAELEELPDDKAEESDEEEGCDPKLARLVELVKALRAEMKAPLPIPAVGERFLGCPAARGVPSLADHAIGVITKVPYMPAGSSGKLSRLPHVLSQIECRVLWRCPDSGEAVEVRDVRFSTRPL
jgi:hypothetical protein